MDEPLKKKLVAAVIIAMIVAIFVLVIFVIYEVKSPSLFINGTSYVDSLIIDVNKIIESK